MSVSNYSTNSGRTNRSRNKLKQSLKDKPMEYNGQVDKDKGLSEMI